MSVFKGFLMDLNISDISRLLLKPEKDILQFVRKKEIPFSIVHDRIVFNKHHIIEWALERNLPMNISNTGKFTEYRIKDISSLMNPDAFFYDCELEPGTHIDKMISMIQLEPDVDREIIVQLLKSREKMMSTAIGNGIALPHPRVPLMVGHDRPLINFFFLKTPIDLNSVDGKPVHTVILLISQTINQHLSLLAHISFLLSKPSFYEAIEKREPYDRIIAVVRGIENERTAGSK